MSVLLSNLRRQLSSASHLNTLQALYWLCALAVLVRLFLFVVVEPVHEPDTQILVHENIPAIRACLSEGRLSGCAYAGPLPLFQFVPSFILNSLGFKPSTALDFFAYLSFISFAAALLLIFLTLRRRASPALAAAAVLLMLTGPLVWYSHSTFGEMVAAVLMLASTSASILRAPGWLLAALFVLAGTTKEVALPFLLLFGLLALLPEIIARPREVRRQLLGLFAGAILLAAITAAFNYFRFATPYNAAYLQEIQFVPTAKLQLSFFFGLWFSPNGGLAFFWPSFVIIYCALLGSLLSRKAKGNVDESRRRWLFYVPVVSISLSLFVLTLGFSRWYAPFGWVAWGPRLMLPWIPAVLLLLFHFYSKQVRAILTSVLKKTSGLVLTCVILVATSLPQFMILFAPNIIGHIFAPTPGCPRRPILQEDAPYYYHCMKTLVWPKRLTLLEAFPVAVTPAVVLFSIFYSVTLVGGCLWIRKMLRREAT